MSKVKIQGNAGGTGIFTVAAPATNTDRTLNLPDADATLLSTAGGTVVGQLVVNQNNSAGVAAISLPQDESTIQGPYANTAIRMGGNLVLRAAGQASIDTAGTARVVVDSSGRITLPYQPSFCVRKESVGNTTFSEVTAYDSADFNVGSYFNLSTGRFTAPVAGVYWFGVTVGWSSNNYSLDITLNGATRKIRVESNGTQAYWVGSSVVVKMNASDYVSLYKGGAGSNSLGGSGQGGFSGMLIG